VKVDSRNIYQWLDNGSSEKEKNPISFSHIPRTDDEKSFEKLHDEQFYDELAFDVF